MALRFIFTVTLLVLGLAALPDVFGSRGTTDVAMSSCTEDVEIEHKLTGYGQWIHVEISYFSPDELVIRYATLSLGKWYKDEDMNFEIQTPNDIQINKTQPGDVWSCGRSDSPTGTAGSFELWEAKDDGAKVSTVSWSCPWSAVYSNKLTIETNNVNYIVGYTGGNLGSGAIGQVKLKVVRIPSLNVI